VQVVGNYSLNIEFGGTVTTITPQMIRELTITLDIERLLPVFKLTLKDATKLLAEVAPYDKNTNSVRIEFARGADPTEFNTFDFDVKRRNTASPDEVYSIEGILSVPNVLTNYYSRSYTGSVKTNLETIIAAQDMGISSTQIGSSLDYEKTLLQPNWTDAKFLRYLRQNIIGKDGEAGYYSFVKVERGERILVVKSLNELLATPVRYNFIVGHKEHQDYYPIGQYRIFDNSQLIMDLTGQASHYRYFDWDTGSYISSEIPISDCPALSEFFLVDSDNTDDSSLYIGTGRSNDFTSDFDGRVRNDFYRRTNSLVYMWASTWGLENISPGDLVQVVFSEALERGDLFLYQHTGLWMVKRVVHIIGTSYMTNLELTRCGIDTDISTTLLETTNRKR
jgi:hypothetical protein